MATPTLEVLGISTGGADEYHVSSGIEGKSAPQPRLRLHGRITVFDQDGSFDMVKIRLRGAIRSRIGAHVAVEKLPTSTELRSNLDFKPVYAASQQHTDEQHLDFVCPIPSTNDRRKSSPSKTSVDGRRKSSISSDMLDRFTPSMTISGSTYITRVTALKDRHLVQGSCDVVYWLEAHFLRSDSRELVRKLSCSVDISSLVMPMKAEVSSPTQTGDTERLEQVAKSQQVRPINRFFTSQPHAELSVNMPRQLGYLVSDSSSLATGCRRLSIPAAVNVVVPSPSHDSQRPRGEAPHTQCLKCSIKAKWLTRKTFSTGSSAVESVIHNNTVSAHELGVALPPLYSDSPELDPSRSSFSSSVPRKYSTSMDVDLLLPESVTTPSTSTELLDISYTLDLTMKFESDDMLKGPYTTHFSLPVTLRAAQPYSVIGRHCFDPLLGYIEEGVEEFCQAPPPYTR